MTCFYKEKLKKLLDELNVERTMLLSRVSLHSSLEQMKTGGGAVAPD